jgi:hypothetical protein
MKNPISILSFLFFLKPFNCAAQHDYGMYEDSTSSIEIAIKAYTDSLLSNGFDTTITFSCPGCFGVRLYDDKGNTTEDASLVVAYSGQKLEIVKFIFGNIDSLKINGIGMSKKIEINNKDTLHLFRTLTKQSEGENLAPYVYETRSNGYIGYIPLVYSHPICNNINIKSKFSTHFTSVEEFSVKEKIFDLPNQPSNINLEYNKHLSIFLLYKLLVHLSDRVYNFKD